MMTMSKKYRVTLEVEDFSNENMAHVATILVIVAEEASVRDLDMTVSKIERVSGFDNE
jgi:hypothetical protein